MKAKYTNVPVQYEVRRSQQKQKRKTEKPARDKQHKEAPNKPNQTKNRPRQQNKPKPRKRGSHTQQPGQRTTRRADKTKQNKGAGGKRKRRPANKERADAREGSKGRREKAAQAKKAGACSFSGVLRGFWITRERILQCRSEGYMNNTTTWCRGQSPTQGRSLCCHEAE